MKKLILALTITVIFGSVALSPIASAGQYCTDGSWSSSNKIAACTKHGGVLKVTSKAKVLIPSVPVSETNIELVVAEEAADKSTGKIRGLCSRINKYAPGTC